MKRIGYLIIIAMVFFLGMAFEQSRLSSIVEEGAAFVVKSTRQQVREIADLDTRTQILLENPRLLSRIALGGAFGGEYSVLAAKNMFSRLPNVVEDIKNKTEIIEIAERTYLIRLPIVNVILFETDEGNVLVDTGMAPAGPAIYESIRKINDLPIHSVIYTHGHVDHAYGTWAIIENGETPEIIAHKNLSKRFTRYIRLRGSIAKYMSQPEEQLPTSEKDFTWPTKEFENRLELDIGGETFVLQHHPGETDDQLYVWAPSRRILASADYYQGFLPNAGNGKRIQRDVEGWAKALREMAKLNATILLPSHGTPIIGPKEINTNLSTLADALEFIVEHTIRGLNAGLRKDEIAASLSLPDHLAQHPTLEVQYVNPEDISKMVLKKYTGWWDDIPSHWSPAPISMQGEMIISLANQNIPRIIKQGRELIKKDLRLASHLADWLFYARPRNKLVQNYVHDVYKARILSPSSNTMEMLTYLDQMARAREVAAEN